MGRVIRWRVALAVAVGVLAPASAAQAAEVPVGSASRPSSHQFDHVPGLWAGTTGLQAETERGELELGTRPGRCQATGAMQATLVRSAPRPAGVRLPSRRVRLRGARARSLVLSARRVDTGGVDPTSEVVLTGRIPTDLAAGEPRRTLLFSVSLTAEEEGCLRAVGRAAERFLPTLYLRQHPTPPPRVEPSHSPTRRIDGGAPGRIGGPGPGAAIGGIAAAGDLDGDGREDVLLQEAGLGDQGVRFRGLVRFGGVQGLVDSAGFGGAGFALAGARDAGGEGPNFAPAGNFLGGPATALAAAVAGRQVRAERPPPGRQTVAVVVPGRRYRGFLDPRRAPPGSVQVTAPSGCGSDQPRLANVGDVNGDGHDDLYVARTDDCSDEIAGIVFGGPTGEVALDAPGHSLRLNPKELEGRAPIAAGDVNGDGLGDMALVGEDALGPRNDELVLVLGRRGAGTISVRSGPGLVHIRHHRCDRPGDVAPAGDLNGDGAGELVVGLGECRGRPHDPDVAHVLRGSRSLPGRVTLGPATGMDIRSRFGPLASPAVTAGRDVSGGPGPDIALGFSSAGPDQEGETWILRDVRGDETLTLGALGSGAVRLLGAQEGHGFGSDVALVGDQTGDGRADLLVAAPEEDFAGRPRAGTVYTYAAGAAPGPPCTEARSGAGRIRGTDLGDALTGSPGPDRLIGFEGGDCLSGLGGRDRLVGDPGPDRLDGGPGDDRLNGGPGVDILAGGAGDDLLLGGPRGDVMTGARGDDRIDARYGAGDRVAAGAGDDLVRASDRGADRIDCGPGRDTVVADRGDRLRGCERVVRYSPPVYDD